MNINFENVTLAPFKVENITIEYIDWLNNKELLAHSEQRHRTHSRESCLAYLNTFDQETNYFWRIGISNSEDNTADHMIGTMTAYIDPHNAVCDLGILIGNKNYRGQGLALKAWSAAISFLFEHKNMRKITGGCMCSNLAMLTTMKRAGMTQDGIRSRQFIQNNSEFDAIYMAIFKNDYFKE